MPYFRIHISYADGSSLTCIRQHTAYDIEFANHYFTEQLRTKGTGKQVEAVEVVMMQLKDCYGLQQTIDISNFLL